MSNMEKLIQSDNKSMKLFGETIDTFRQYQGHFGRLYEEINELPEDECNQLFEKVKNQNFIDAVDIMFWLSM